MENPFESASTLDDVDRIVRDWSLNKGCLMRYAYNNDLSSIDSALPIKLWDELKEYGGTFYFIVDYRNNIYGELVHLGERLLGIKTNWDKKLQEKK